MAARQVSDLEVAKQAWVQACGNCFAAIDPLEREELGRCSHCGHRFSTMRLMTEEEARAFVEGKFRVNIKFDGRCSLKTVNGMQDVPPQIRRILKEYVRKFQLMREQVAKRREIAQRREELYAPRRSLQAVKRFPDSIRRIHGQVGIETPDGI